MTMLSSVAERLYWMARYLERAEDTARLTNAYSQFILDIPVGSEPGWESLVGVIDGQAQFESRYSNYSERNVMKFMTADLDNLGSIRYSVKAARECVRTTRDVLPDSCWELVNELYIFANDFAESSISRKARFEFLEGFVARVEQITGLIVSNLSRDHAYHFIRMGRLIERAEMTTRIVDVAATSVQARDSESTDASWLLGYLLRSLSAVTAYRREVGPQFNENDVVNFVFKAPDFPRSLQFCLAGIKRDAKRLKNREEFDKACAAMLRKISRFDAARVDLAALHQYVDGLQERLIKLNNIVYSTWFSR